MIHPHITTISLFPTMFDALSSGIPGRALDKGLLTLSHLQLRDFAEPPHYRVDDRPYGGGPGMVMCYAPLAKAIAAAKAKLPQGSRVIHLSPQGKPVTHQKIVELSQLPGLTLVASRYEGIDARLLDTHIDEEISVADCVVSGGELPAMILIDALIRLLPDALGDADSALQDSFASDLLDHPHYTRPELINNLAVPPVLLSGDHAAIKAWRDEQSLKKTWQMRPDLIKRDPSEKSETTDS